MSTIHMSLWFTVRPFPYVKLLSVVLDVDLNREVVGIALSGGRAGEHPRNRAHPWGCSVEPRTAQGGPPMHACGCRNGYADGSELQWQS